MNRTKTRDAVFALALWLLGTIYFGANLAPTRLLVEMKAGAPDTAQVFFSGAGAWKDADSLSMPVFAGYNRVIFVVPPVRPGGNVRFDPGMHAGAYQILSMNWLRGGITHAVPLDTIINPRSSSSSMKLRHTQLELQASDEDPQLIVPAPGWAWTVASAAVWPGLPVLGLLLVYLALRRNASRLRMAGFFLAACASVYFIYCLRFGPLLPYYDDWRYLYSAPSNLIDGDWQWVTLPSNDTLFLTGQVLDYLVLKFSNVDFFWLRVFALALLMLHLATQYRVISRVAGAQPAVAAVAVALGIWSLSSAAYWGGTAMAYQQGLPTLFGTLCLAQLSARNGEFNPRFSSSLLALFCLASGLSYISGGVLLLSLGISCLLMVDRSSQIRVSPASQAGWILLSVGATSLALQLMMVVHQQGSLLEHNHAVASVYPNDRRFWLFFFALYGRSLGYSGPSAFIDIGLAALMLSPAIFLGIDRLARRNGAFDSHGMWTLLAIYAGIGSVTYAGIVAFGRAGFVPADASAVDIVTFGKSRFHYWPIATMAPYAWLGWSVIAQRLRHRANGLGAVVATLLLLPKSLFAFDHNPSFIYARSMTMSGAHCVVEHLADIDGGRPVECPVMTGGNYDVGPAILRLRARNSPSYRRFMQEGGAPDFQDKGDPLFQDHFD